MKEEFNDGSFVEIGSFSGGTHPDGEWSHLELIFTDKDGNEKHRFYTADDVK